MWLMRQAGRYMAAFREYSDKYPFRMRSETPEIAIELSLQPWRAFKTDGIIFFSDILTPLPALGVEFDVIKGKGPRIDNPLRSMEQVKQLKPLDDPSSSLPFIHEILSTIRWGEVSSVGRTDSSRSCRRQLHVLVAAQGSLLCCGRPPHCCRQEQ